MHSVLCAEGPARPDGARLAKAISLREVVDYNFELEVKILARSILRADRSLTLRDITWHVEERY